MKVVNISTREVLYDSDIDYSGLPEGIRGAMQRYIEDRISPGHFLSNLLSNDLLGTFERADLNNRNKVYDIVHWLYNNAPGRCWGSEEKVLAWLQGN
jgi:hypothetical protein